MNECGNGIVAESGRRQRETQGLLSKTCSRPGLTCIQKKAAGGPGGDECMCILQLTEAGDVFYQILELEQPDPEASRPTTVEDEPLMSERKTAEQPPPHSELVVSDTSSDMGIIGPTQGLTVQRIVAETPERNQQTLNMGSESEDSESEGRSQNLKRWQLQVVVNDDPKLDQVSGSDTGEQDENEAKKGRCDEKVVSSSSIHVGPSEQQTVVQLSSSALVTWKQWLQKLMQRSCKKKPSLHRSQHLTVNTKALLCQSNSDVGDLSEECVQSLRQDLRSCMSTHSLLLQSTVPASLSAPDLAPMPDQVDTNAWTDPLSHRLTLSWQGEEVWRMWWEDQLGTNREAKVQALRRKRRKEKEAKRAKGHRLELSGSFTSSVSYQAELDDFSDSTGWSSSQVAYSDTEGGVVSSELEDFLEVEKQRAATPSTIQTDTPVPTLSATPQSVKAKQGEQQTPSRPRPFLAPSQTQSTDSTPARQSRNKRPVKDYLSSQFASPGDPSQNNSYFLERGHTMPPPPPHAVSSSSQFHSSQSLPLRRLQVDLSKDNVMWSGSSQSLSLSQSSQERQGLSQVSQPKKKKSRMGF